MILALLGGIGIFLIGMILLSEGLKAAAGGALRSILERFARTPARAVLSGAGVTALVQSSSATTLTTIGFVSAGLLSFPQAVGLIFGANLGTTSTGWLVAVLGFKVDMGALAFPLVGAGALLRLLGRGRWAHGGMALAGFGLIFVGIDTLQEGMAGLAERIDPASLPGASLGGRFLLVLIGAVMTVVMQSSSAAVATTLTALHAGGIGVEQAALLVIGQNLGTSVKAMLAAIGGGVPVRRTAVAHTMFNLITAALALLFLPVLLFGALTVSGEADPALAIALFHTGFNLLGVAVLFPVLNRFADLVERVVPETRPSLTRNLDPAVAQVPEVAVEAASRSALAAARLLSSELARLLRSAVGIPVPKSRRVAGVEEVPQALVEVRGFLARVRAHPEGGDGLARHLSLLHAVDHLDRLDDLRRDFGELGDVPPELHDIAGRVAGMLEGWIETGDVEAVAEFSRALAGERRARRARTLQDEAVGGTSAESARLAILHVKRMDRIVYHGWRAAFHLEIAGGGSASGPPPDPRGPGPQDEASASATGEVMPDAPAPRSMT
ncbi:MAG: Na/Pi cotransporter family protein [Gemmatimonadales bacterium]|nr:MAG: Na/Pi cotransporter family protein [Gemmatimonadales bacterium]